MSMYDEGMEAQLAGIPSYVRDGEVWVNSKLIATMYNGFLDAVITARTNNILNESEAAVVLAVLESMGSVYVSLRAKHAADLVPDDIRDL